MRLQSKTILTYLMISASLVTITTIGCNEDSVVTPPTMEVHKAYNIIVQSEPKSCNSRDFVLSFEYDGESSDIDSVGISMNYSKDIDGDRKVIEIKRAYDPMDLVFEISIDTVVSHYPLGVKGLVKLKDVSAYHESSFKEYNWSSSEFTKHIVYDLIEDDLGFTYITESTAVGYGGKGYIICGAIGDELDEHTHDASNIFLEFNPTDSSIIKLKDFPGAARMSNISFIYGSSLYTGLGTNSIEIDTTYNDIWKYDFETNEWNFVTELPFEHGSAGGPSFVIDNFVYLGLGMSNENGTITGITKWFKYDLDSDLWFELSDAPVNSFSASPFFQIGNDFYVGSVSSSSDKRVFKYNISLDTWTEISPKIHWTFDSQCFTSNGKGYVYSGHGGLYSHYIEEYNPIDDTWKSYCIADYNFSFWEGIIFSTKKDEYYIGFGQDRPYLSKLTLNF